MSEGFKIFLTSSLTIIGGLFLLVVGQIVTRLLFDPMIELRKQIGEIADVLIYYANVYTNPGIGDPETLQSASTILRQKASLLRSKSHAVSGYGLFVRLKLVPAHRSIVAASANLIGLSNSCVRGDPMVNLDRAKDILKLLGLPDDL